MLSVLTGQEWLILHSSHTLVGSTAMCQFPAWDELVGGTGVGWEWTGEDGMGM